MSTTVPSVNQLKKAIDPEVWAVRYKDMSNLGAQWEWEQRRASSTRAAERVRALLLQRQAARGVGQPRQSSMSGR